MSLERTNPVGYLREAIGFPENPSGRRGIIRSGLRGVATALFPLTVAYNDQINRRGHEAPLGSGKYGAGTFAILTDFYVSLATLPFLPVLWPIKATANTIAPALARGMARITHGPLQRPVSKISTSEPVSERSRTLVLTASR